MKRVLSLVLAFAIVFSLASQGLPVKTAAAEPEAPSIPATDAEGKPNNYAGFGTAELDGQKDGIYSKGQTVAVNQKNGGGVDTSGDAATGEVTVVFDAESLYVFVEVEDDTPVYNESGATIVNDVEGVNFFIDFINTVEGNSTYGSSGTSGEQGRIYANFVASKDGNASYSTGAPYIGPNAGANARKGFTGACEGKMVQTEKGYNVELKIGLSSQLKARLANETNPSIGLGIQINDDTNDSGYKGDNSGRDYVRFNHYEVDNEWMGGSNGGSAGLPSIVLLNENMEKEEDVPSIPAVDAEGKPNYYAGFGSAELDGQKDGIYSKGQTVAVNQKNGGGVDTSGVAATGEVTVVFDAENLYVFVEVEDDTPVYNESGATIVNDVEGVNFFIDFINTVEGNSTYGSSGTSGEQGRIYANFVASKDGNASYSTGAPYIGPNAGANARKGFTGACEGKMVQTEKGYNVELKIGLSSQLKARLANETNPSIGLGIQINDDTNDSGYKGDNSGRDYVRFNHYEVDNEWMGGSNGGSAGLPSIVLLNENMKAYSITVSDAIVGGTLVPSVDKAYAGTTVTVTANAEDGYELIQGSLKVNGEAVEGMSFIMPEEDVVLSADFVKTDAPSIPKLDAEGKPNYYAGFGTAELDGQKDSIYSKGQTVAVNQKPNGSVVVNDSAATGEVTVIFDTENLYVFVEVTDSTPVYNASGATIVNDVEGVNFFVDFINTVEGNALYGKPGSFSEQGRIYANFVASKDGNASYSTGAPYIGGDAGANANKGFTGACEGKMVQTEKGYNVELKIALTNQLKERLANDTNPSIGLGIQVNDDIDDSGYTGDNSGRDNVRFNHYEVDCEWIAYPGNKNGGCAGLPSIVLLNEDITFYSITVDEGVTGGTITPNVTKAAPGTIITVSATADYNTLFKAGSITVNGKPISGNTFVMPAEDVVLSAVFEPKTDDNDPDVIKVISQNVLNDASNVDSDHGGVVVSNVVRAARMGKLFNEIRPDSIGFQEVVGDSRGWAKLLAENFPDYAYVGFGRDFTGSNNTVSEDYANNVCSGEATPIFYLKDKYELVEAGTWWISKTPGINPGGTHYPEDKDAAWNATYKMTLTWAVLKNKENGKIYAHINTHLDPVNPEARNGGMGVVLRKTKDLLYAYGATLPVVITADWNCNQWSEAYKILTTDEEVTISDGAYCLPEEDLVNWGGTIHSFTGDRGSLIDIAFITSDTARVTHYEVLTQAVDAGDGKGAGCLSDHYGIYISFKPGEPCEEVREVTDVETGKEQDLTAAFGTPELDGVKDDIYNESIAANVNVDSNGQIVSNQSTAIITTVHDDKYIYCFAEVTDLTPVDKLKSPAPEYDDVSEGVAFFFDYLNTAESDEKYIVDGEQGPIRLGYAALTGEVLIPKNRLASMPYEYKIVRTENGYNIELRVEMSESLQQKIAGGDDTTIGIGFQVNDDKNNDGGRDDLCFSNKGIDAEWMYVAPYIDKENGGCKGFDSITLLGKESAECEHVLSDAISDGNGKHYKECTVEGCDYTTEAEDCTPNEGDCVTDEVCTVCGFVTKAAEGHTLTRVEATDATYEADGNIEHYICSVCGAYFSDAEGKNEITPESVVIPMLVKKPEDGKPEDEKPDEEDPEDDENPKTGDMLGLSLLAILSSAAALFVGKRKNRA